MTTPTPFTIPWPNPDIWVNPAPEEDFHRVAVISGWHDAERCAKRWGYKPAVVGPLRSVRGIDLLIRSILANPAIRVLVWDGPDLTGTQNRLKSLWYGQEGTELADDIEPYMQSLRGDAGVWLLTYEQWENRIGDRTSYSDLWLPPPDRPGGPVILPPPPPVATARVPHVTAPRFEADTLADLWPQLLAEILQAGREIPTHYGDTLEVLNMVGVVRDPRGSLGELGGWPPPECGLAGIVSVAQEEAHPLFGFSWAKLEKYTTEFTGASDGEGMSYKYGNLMAGDDPVVLANGDEWHADGRFGTWAYLECTKCPPDTTNFDMDWSDEDMARLMNGKLHCPRGHELNRSDLRATAPATKSGYPMPLLAPDQFAALDDGLAGDPAYRGHFLTPWHPSRFTGLAAKGKPCLVGVQFRVTEDDK